MISQKPMSELGLTPDQAGSVRAFIQVKDSRLALAAASHAFYGEPAKKLTLTGVTGTKGKTTTTYLIRSILTAAGIKTGMTGSVENDSGSEITSAKETTPESIDLARLYSKMAESGCKHAVTEVSSQALALSRTAFCEFETGVFTNFYRDHISLREHADMEDYFNAKLKLFMMCRKAVVNADIKEYSAIREFCEKTGSCGTPITYSADAEGVNHKMADVRAERIELVRGGGGFTRFYVETPWFAGTFSLGLPGRYNVSNALAAIAVCGLYGAPENAVAGGLGNVAVRGRTQRIDEGQDFTVLVDFAHNAASLEAILTMLREYEFSSVTTVFGCGGTRSRDRRFEMGGVSGRLSGLTVVTSDNPRGEDPADIIADIETGLRGTGGKYIVIEDRREAIRYAIDSAPGGGLVLIAGKGHETGQEFADRTVPFDDAQTARELLRGAVRRA